MHRMAQSDSLAGESGEAQGGLCRMGFAFTAVKAPAELPGTGQGSGTCFLQAAAREGQGD